MSRRRLQDQTRKKIASISADASLEDVTATLGPLRIDAVGDELAETLASFGASATDMQRINVTLRDAKTGASMFWNTGDVVAGPSEEPLVELEAAQTLATSCAALLEALEAELDRYTAVVELTGETSELRLAFHSGDVPIERVDAEQFVGDSGKPARLREALTAVMNAVDALDDAVESEVTIRTFGRS